MESNQDFGSLLNNFSGSTPSGPRQDSGDGFGSLLNGYQTTRTQPKQQDDAPASVDEFVKSVAPAAQRVAQRLGVPVDAVIGQWGLETGWGKSVIPGTNNLGNIKSVTGQGVAATDNATGSRDKYRQYASVDEFADDFANLVGNGRYKAVAGSKDAQSYFTGLKLGGYAEDPAYVQKGAAAAQLAGEALKRVGVAQPQQAATGPDLTKAPKWADVEGKPEFKALAPEKQAEAKAAYFDYWIAPHAGQRADELRQQFLAAGANQEPGFLDKVGDAMNAVRDFATGVGGSLAPTRGSVMDRPGVQPPEELPTTSKVPVRPEVRAAFNAAWDAASPEQRADMQVQPGWTGMLARERAGVFERQDASGLKTAGMVDPRVEARQARLAAGGEDPRFAERAARDAAAAGVMPGREIEYMQKGGGLAQESKFDFGTKQAFDQQGGTNGLNNPLTRGLAKGALGVGKAVTGYGEFLADTMGLDHASKTMREGGNWARGQEQAIGERGSFMERNFEGAISSIAQQLPLLITGTKLETEAIPLAGMAMQSFGQEYSDGRAAGQSVGEATTRASIFAAFEVIGEKFGLKESMQAIKAAARGLPSDQIVGFLWSALKKEIPGELLTTTGQFATDKLPGGIGLNQNATGADYLKQVADTVAQTIMQSGMMAGGTTGVSKAIRYTRDKGPLEGVAEADAELARQQALNKWNTNGLTNKLPGMAPDAAPTPASTTPDGRIEPTLQGDLPVTPAETAGAPAIHPTTQAADNIVRELAAQAGIPHETVLPTPAPQQTTGPESVSDQDVLDFAATRFQQLREKRDGSIQSVVGESGIVDQDMPGVGLSAAEQQELDALQRAGGDPRALRALYGFDPTIPSDASANQTQAQVPAPATGPVDQPVQGKQFPAATEPGLVAAQENANVETQIQDQGTGPALDQGAVVPTGQPSWPAAQQEPAAQAAGTEVGAPAGQRYEGLPAQDAVTESAAEREARLEREAIQGEQAPAAKEPQDGEIPFPPVKPKTEKEAKARRTQTEGEVDALMATLPNGGFGPEKVLDESERKLIRKLIANIIDKGVAAGKSNEEILAQIHNSTQDALGGLSANKIDQLITGKRNGTQADQAQQAEAQQPTPQRGTERQVGREGYDTPVEIDAAALKSIIERTRGEPLVDKPAKLEAWRNGNAKTDPNQFPIELAFTPDGRLDVNDGRHRIALAAERGEKVKAFISGKDAKRVQELIANEQAPAETAAAAATEGGLPAAGAAAGTVEAAGVEPGPLVKAMNDLAEVRARIADQGQVVDDRLLSRERQLKSLVKELEAGGQNDDLDAEMRSYEAKADKPRTEKEAKEQRDTESRLYTKDADLKNPTTLDELIGAVDAGYRVHFDYAGADGRTLWIAQTEKGWVLKSQEDGSTATFAKGGAGMSRWSKAEALKAAENDARHRFTEWKPIAPQVENSATQGQESTVAKPVAQADNIDSKEQDNGNTQRSDSGTAEGAVASTASQRPAAVGDERTPVDLAGGEPAQAQDADRGKQAPADAQKPQASTGAGERVSDRPADAARQPDGEAANGRTAADTVASNFTITDELNFAGLGAKTKYANNVAAIRLLKQLEAEGRQATAAEQANLAKYIGWGGMPQAFDPKNDKWAKEFAELKELLTPEEYATAASSTRNAHYTAAPVVEAIWSGVSRLGFRNGAVLEPSLGSGNFFGLMPDYARSKSRLFGVEFDHITGGIAKQLYPQAKVNAPVGFQDIKIAPESFDLAIGNPPFGDESLYDKNHTDASKFKIHGFFFAKSVDTLKPGGVLAMVVSKGLMDANDARGKSTRAWLAERTRLLGAIRLPNSAFQENANTEVTTDIIFLQKLTDGVEANTADWNEMGQFTDKETGQPIAINKYFASHPDMMLGEMTLAGSMYRANEPTLAARPGDNLPELLAKAIEKLPQGVFKTGKSTFIEAGEKANKVTTAEDVREYGYFLKDGKLFQRMPDYNGERQSVAVAKEGKELERITGMVGLRDLVRKQLALEKSADSTDAEIEANRAALNKAYDTFVKKYGFLSSQTNKRLYTDDSDAALVLSLEAKYDKGVTEAVAKTTGQKPRQPKASKATIFTKRVQTPVAMVTKASTAKEAMLASLNERGRIDPEFMAGLYGKTFDEILAELGDLVFEDPGHGWVPADLYLSGNVKAALAVAKEAEKHDARFQRNVTALMKVQPADINPSDIFVKIGSPWVSISDYNDFAKETFGGKVTGSFLPATGNWSVDVARGTPTENNTTFGTERMGAHRIIETLMSNKQVAVYDEFKDADGNTKRVLNAEETAAAQGKADALAEAFQEWIWKDNDRRERLSRVYNDTYNTNIPRKYDGSHLSLPGMNTAIQLRPHQLNWVYRSLVEGKGLADHVVGAGKTFAIIAAMMEMRRLGLANKPMIVVPNHLVGQWAKDIMALYPGANVLAASRKDFGKDRRKLLFSRIATGDWDMVVVAHSSFGRIPVPPETEQKILDDQLGELITAIQQAKADKGARFTVKDLERAKTRIEEKLKKLADRKQDDALDFADLGVDALSVDEAHEFKNLFYTTTLQGVAGLGNPQGSTRAFDMFVKTRYVSERAGGKNVFFATGTPLANSIAEVFHMQRFLQYETLKARGIHNFDAWANTFGQSTSDWEMNAAGKFVQKTRFRKFANLPELKGIWGEIADTVTRGDLLRDAEAQGKRFPLPKVKGGRPENVVTERSQLQAEFIGIPQQEKNEDGTPKIDENGQPVIKFKPGTIVHRLENWKEASKTNPKEIPLAITGQARKAGLDYRLIDENAPDFEGSKINAAVSRIFDIWKANDHRKGTQLVFCDLSVPASAKGQATADAAEKMPTFFVAEGSNIRHVAGKPLTLAALPDVQLFSHKEGKKWIITERTTGLKFSDGSTKQEAIDAANSRAARVDPQYLQTMLTEKAIPNEAIDDYITRWEEKQSQAEDTGTDDDSEEAAKEISLDEMLADAGGNFSVYDDIKAKLIAKGMPAEQIAFIHDYNTDDKKAALFASVNAGEIRLLLGSTQKMGAGTNVQSKLVALHHMDAPWRPADLEQREGRIIRQGNEFYEQDPDGFEVGIYRYATKQTYDSRMWEIIETKARAIEQFKTDATMREIEDVSSESANAAEMKAGASGNPLILEEISLRTDLRKLQAMKKSWDRSRFDLEKKIQQAESKTGWVYNTAKMAEDFAAKVEPKNKDALGVKMLGITINTEKDIKTEELASKMMAAADSSEGKKAGSYRGIDIYIRRDQAGVTLFTTFKDYTVSATTYGPNDKFSVSGFLTRLDNLAEGAAKWKENTAQGVVQFEKDAENAKKELARGFPKADELKKIDERHKAVVAALRAGKTSLDSGENPTDIKFQANENAGTAKANPTESDLKNVRALNSGVVRYLRKNGQTVDDGVLGYDAAEVPGDAGIRVIAKAWGQKLQWFVLAGGLTQQQRKQFGFFNGAAVGGVTYLNAATDRPHLAVLGHEIVHQLRKDNPDLYDEFVELVAPYIKPGAYKQWIETAKVAKTAETSDGKHEEFMAEIGSDAFMEPGFWERIGQNNPTLLGKIVAIAKELIALANAALGSKPETKGIVSDYDAVMRIASDVLARYLGSKVEADTQAGDIKFSAGGGQTDTPAFRKWFGDSKVVDAQGKPLVVYHGARAKDGFSVFRGPRSYFAESPDYAAIYSGDSGDEYVSPSIMPVYLRMQKPLDLTALGSGQHSADVLADALEAAGARGAASLARSRLKGREQYVWALWHSPDFVREVKEAGFDGVIQIEAAAKDDKMVDGKAYMVFEPTQIKSAIGNNGNFDPNDANIRFQANENGPSLSDITRRTQNNLLQFFGNRGSDKRSLKTFGLYDRTLSTQYNKALKDKHYGKVFAYVNAMQNEVSLTSIRPSELAPGVLPRVDDVKSAAKQLVKGKKSDMNLEQAASAIFAGTLDGDSVMTGRVWSEEELRNKFGLTDTGVALYRQARAAIDASLDEVAAAEGYAMAQGFVPKTMRRQIIDNPQNAEAMLVGEIKKQLKMLDKAIKAASAMGAVEQEAELKASRENYLRTKRQIEKIFVTAKNLKSAGYAPLMRFGKYTVTVQAIDPATGNVLRDDNGEVITEFFGQYETEGEAKAARAQMEAKYRDRDDIRVKAGTKSQSSHELYAGISPETLALFAEAVGADAAMRKHIELAMSERSALKRRLHRKGTQGYSEDLPRVLSQFITSNGRHAAQRYYLRDLNNAIKYIPKEKGDVLDDAVRLKKFVLNPNDPAAPVSSIMFAWFLGGSVASAMVNLTQPVMMTGPYLSQFGIGTATKAMASAMPYAMGRKEITDTELRTAIKRASQEGIVDAQEIFHLYSLGAQGVASGLVNQLAKLPGVGSTIKAGSEDARARINAFLTLWGSMFAVAEGFNRKLTFIAAWEVAKANGEKNPYAFAVRAVNETQGIYNKVNRPNWGQGPVGRTLLTFKQFSLMYVELLSRMWKRGGPEGKRAALIMLAVLMLASGEEGLPFAQDLDDLIDTVGQMFGLDTNMRRNKRRVAHEILGKELGDLFLYGVSSHLPLDFAGRLGLGNLIPGTGLLKPSDSEIRGRQLAEVVGPTAGMATQIGDAYDAVVEGNNGKAVQNLSPKAVKDVLAAGEMAKKGYSTDSKGRKVVDVTKGDAAWKGIGFQPTTVAQETRKTMPVYQDIALQKRTESSIVNQWVRGLTDNDMEMVKEAQTRLTEWNRKNPGTPIQIKPEQIRSQMRQQATPKDARLLKQAPREMRGGIGLDLAK